MQLSGEQRIRAPRQAVWDGLNDPEVLRRSIPGCQSLERLADGRMQATVEIKIGPIGARFNGLVSLSDQVPPQSYTISGEGQGGTVGNAKGGAKVRLVEDGDGTLLSYEVEAQVGGRLAQLGGPIIDATAKQLAAKFFRQFGDIVATPAAEPSAPRPADQVTTVSETGSPTASAGVSASYRAQSTSPLPAAWLLSLLAAALIGYLVGHAQAPAAAAEWIGLAIGLMVLVVGAAAFEYGRRAATTVFTLDADTLRRLARGEGE